MDSNHVSWIFSPVHIPYLPAHHSFRTMFHLCLHYSVGILSRDDRTRTCDLMVPNHAFYQLNYIPIFNFQRTLALYQKSCQTFLLKRKDSNLQCTLAAVLPETNFALLLIYMTCKHFVFYSRVYHSTTLQYLEHMVGFEPTVRFRIGFCRPMVSTTRPHVHLIPLQESNLCLDLRCHPS